MKKSRKLIIFIVVIAVLATCLIINWRGLLLLPRAFPAVNIEAKVNPESRSFSERVWLHKVDDYNRLSEGINKYKGLEIDIHYDSTRSNFYVSHDPDPQEYIYLDEFLGTVENVREHYFGLDFKNVSEDNYKPALALLDSICAKYQIDTHNVIVESNKPQYLSEYTSAGFNTSYYLPTFNPYNTSDEKIVKHAQAIDSVLVRNNVTYVSANYKQYYFIKEYFPGRKMLLWQTHKNLLAPYLRDKILEDPDIIVLLVS